MTAKDTEVFRVGASSLQASGDLELLKRDPLCGKGREMSRRSELRGSVTLR